MTSSAGAISVTDDGSITVASGAAITQDSNASITTAGELVVEGGNGAAGIIIQPNLPITLTNSGAITVEEDFVPEDDDVNSIVDGPIASASNRYGIHVLGGGTATGNLTNSGNITVDGLNSAGIAVDSTLNGNFLTSGTTLVTGDYSYGIRLASVTGNVTQRGVVTAVGEGAIALAVTGDVGGLLTLQGTLSQAASFTNDDDGTSYLSRQDLRVSAPAVLVAGNVAQGIVVAIPPTDTSSSDTDEDDDGVTDTAEGSGVITSYGNGPALLIGGATDTVIGASSSTDNYSLLVQGTVSGNAYYSRTDAYGIVIGGQGGNVSLPGGIGVTGTVTATTNDSMATALLINSGSTVSSLYNSGTIKAAISSPGEGEVYGIVDKSGTLSSITNTGFITATATSTDISYAIDLSANTSGVTITQYMNDDDLATRADVEDDLDEGETDTTVYTAITGNILTGSGNDTLTANAGQIVGNTYFGAGDDQLLLSGEAYYKGKVYFGTGSALAALSGTASFVGTMDFASLPGVLTVADSASYRGTVTNGGAASVVVSGGSFGANSVTTTTIGSLTVQSGGALHAYIDGATGTSSLLIANTATFASGATVSATVNSLYGAEGSYVILSAGTLNGTATFDAATTDLPYIFTGSLSTSGNDLILGIRLKTAGELGISGAGVSAYDAILAAAANDDTVGQSFLDITDVDTLQSQVNQLLPDYSGGIFDNVTRASRLVAQHVMDGDSIFDISNVGAWLEPMMWHSGRDATENSSAYKTSGWGISSGVEWASKLGYFGLSYAWLSGKVENNGGTGTIDTTQHEIGAFWRLAHDTPLYAFARVSAARTSFSSTRTFSGTADDSDFTYTNSASWNGWLFSAAAGASYRFDLTPRLRLRPKLVVDWYDLEEDGYTESGGGDAMDLTVQSRSSHSVAASTTVSLSYALQRRHRDSRPLTVEIEAGRRSMLSGGPGATTASFADGENFTLTPDPLDSAWLGEMRILAGGLDYTWKLSAGAEKSPNGDIDYSARASLSVAF